MSVPPPVNPWLHATIGIALALHIGGGTIALVSGTAAACARKGGALHRAAGNLFFGAMLVMALFAGYLAVAVPNQLFNLFVSGFTAYLVATAWMTVRRRQRTIGVAEKAALAIAIILCTPFVILAVQLAAGLPPLVSSAIPFKGPVLVALYVFTSVLLLAAIGDARLVFAGEISGRPRIARHLWRMCLGLSLAAGSAFTNGAARLLPGPYHVPPIFFLPQFLPLGLLIFWMIRVRFTAWLKPDPLTQPA